MEDYANIVNHEDFDIEGRNPRHTRNEVSMPRQSDEQRLLSLRVKVDDNTYGYIFSLRANKWRCHLCDVLIVGQDHVDTHIQTKKHQLKLALPLHPRHIFGRLENGVPEKSGEGIPLLAPGEPVPPGFEDVVKRVAQIQSTLDSYKKTPLIGLEYLVEITPDERGKEPLYICMLCDKKGDPRVVMSHLISFNHRSTYINLHYPTAYRMLNREYPRNKDQNNKKMPHIAMNHLCTKIEEKYGRLLPCVVEKEYFEANRADLQKEIENEKHFRETAEETFVECLSKETIESLAAAEDAPVAEQKPPFGEDRKRSKDGA